MSITSTFVYFILERVPVQGTGSIMCPGEDAYIEEIAFKHQYRKIPRIQRNPKSEK